MKNTLSFLSIALIAITFVSCEKDYTCTCTEVDSSGILDDKIVHTITTGKRSDAEDECSAKSATVGTIITTCELK